MEQIAALAATSKQTVYKHFADKERLFTEIVISTVNEASDQVSNEVVSVQDSGDVEADLRDLARSTDRFPASSADDRGRFGLGLVIRPGSCLPCHRWPAWSRDVIARPARLCRRCRIAAHVRNQRLV